jgi:hypothetical protein
MPADSGEAIGSARLYAAFVSHIGLFVRRDDIAQPPFVSTSRVDSGTARLGWRIPTIGHPHGH